MSSPNCPSARVVSLRRVVGRVVGHVAEELESRRLFCALHDGDAVDAQLPTSAAIQAALASYSRRSATKAAAKTSYTAARKVTISTKTAGTSGTGGSTAVKRGLVVTPVTLSTNAAGLPLLSSRSDGAGLKIFLDFDGDGANSAYDTNGVEGTFDTAEQTVVYNAWRDVVSFFSPYNVNVTTIQPPTGGSNPVFVWQVISNDAGGSAYVGTINNTSARGWNASSSARSRTSALAHEIGHQLNNYHQSLYNVAGEKTSEYTSGYDGHGAIMGSDFGQDVVKWMYGRSANGNDVFQDDMTRISAYIASKSSSYGDGYRPDDFTGTTLSAATALTPTNGSFQTAGIIERATDADYFRFTSTGQTFNLNVEPTFESAIAPKLELYDAATGKLIAAKDDTSLRAWDDNTAQEFTLDLPAGNYVARVSGHGDYGDQGEYAFYASPLPDGWASADITTTGTGAAGTGRGGYVTYDVSSGIWYQGGSGDDIGGSTDSFHFTYVPLTGNGSIVARVLGFDGVASDANAGIMLREKLFDASRFAMINFTPGGSQTVTRTSVGGAASPVAGSSPMPGYVRITRTDATVTLQRSTNGTTWNAGNTYTFSGLADQVYVGLAVTSADTGQLATASFDNVVVTGDTSPPVPTLNGLAAPTGLTAVPLATHGTNIVLNWNDVAGETGYAIERSVDGVNWATYLTTAADATTYTDPQKFGSMRWWYRLAAIDATGKSAYSNVVNVINRPAAPANGQAVTVSSTKISLSWRDTSGDTGYRIERIGSGESGYTLLGTTPANITGFNVSTGMTAGATYNFRITPMSAVGDGLPIFLVGTTAPPAVSALALTSRQINNVGLTWTDIGGETGYRIERSTDRSTWTSIGTTTSNVTTFTDTTAAALTHYYYRVYGTVSGIDSIDGNVVFAATPPATASAAPWASSDIGTPAGSGAAYTNGTTATVIGGGETLISSSTDEWHYLYKTLTGDGEVIARVATLEDLGQYTRAGVMFRESLAANSKYAAVAYQPESGGQGTDFVYRSGTAGGTAVAGPTDSTYQFVRLVRQGNSITAYASATNSNWTQIGSAVTISMVPTIYVGLAVSSRDDNYLAKATFDNINIFSATPPAFVSAVVNDGSTQRSMVRSLTLSFTQPVMLGAGAITLQRKGAGGAYVASTAPYTLTPLPTGGPSATYSLSFNDVGGSIGDGAYRLLLNAASITNANGTAMTAAATPVDFTRLFGDVDGDGGVSINDFNSLSMAFGTVRGNAAYNGAFDYDADNGISINDFNAFSIRFGITV